MQAYLFHLVVTVFECTASTDVSETLVKQHLLYMQKTLQNDLHPQVKDAITTNCTDSETSHDWTAIQTMMSDLKEYDGPGLEDNLIYTHEATDGIGVDT